MENDYTYEDEINITSEYLDGIDLEKYIEGTKNLEVRSLMNQLEDDYGDSLEDDPFYGGFLFNRMGESEFMDYLKSRFGSHLRFSEVTKTYIEYKLHI